MELLGIMSGLFCCIGLFFLAFAAFSAVGWVYSTLRRIHDEATEYRSDPFDRGW
jgi:hypothetical protein